MAKHHLSPLPLLAVIFLLCTITFAQSPAKAPGKAPAKAPAKAPPPASPQAPAPTPGPSGPVDIVAILKKAGHFTTLIRLLKTTQVEEQINHQVNNSTQGVTLFAPDDNVFGNLTTGTLNKLTDQQKIELMQFHVLPVYVPDSKFQTVSNPVQTQAGAINARLLLNVTTIGTQVNISTGIVNASIVGTAYSDGQLAVYQVDQVLLPNDLFGAPALAPAPSNSGKKAPSPGSASSSDVTSSKTSGTTILIENVSIALSFVVSIIAAFAMS